MKLIKKYKFILLGLSLILILTILYMNGTLSYYSSSFKAISQTDASTYNIEIIEEFDETWQGSKRVSFKNNGDEAVYIRISYNEIWSKLIDNQVININNLDNKEDIVTKNFTNTFINDFTYIDGWYYYNKELKPQEIIQVLDSITLNKEEYKSYDYELTFNYESTINKVSAAKSLFGVTPTINGGVISWA